MIDQEMYKSQSTRIKDFVDINKSRFDVSFEKIPTFYREFVKKKISDMKKLAQEMTRCFYLDSFARALQSNTITDTVNNDENLTQMPIYDHPSSFGMYFLKNEWNMMMKPNFHYITFLSDLLDAHHQLKLYSNWRKNEWLPVFFAAEKKHPST